MDTSDLSEQAYRCLITAEGFSHDLTIEFGVLASRSKNENEFLEDAKLLIQEIEEEIDDFLEENIREEHRIIPLGITSHWPRRFRPPGFLFKDEDS